MRYHIAERNDTMPASAHTVYCDGSGGDAFRPSADIELSHWIPNRTPTRYKADSSTEICLKFITDPPDHEFDLVVNNHVDVDGILSAYVLLNADSALADYEVLVKAAEIGDFSSWGNESALILFQGLTLLMDDLEKKKAASQVIYGQCMDAVPDLLKNSGELAPAARKSLEGLYDSLRYIESGAIRRVGQHAHFVRWEIPKKLSAERLEAALYVPYINEAVSTKCLLWPQARARVDEQKISLISVEGDGGWFHDVWYPGYSWAETPDRWRPTDITSAEPLRTAIAELAKAERNPGRWWTADELSLSGQQRGRPFPIVASFLSGYNQPTVSSITPDRAAGILSNASYEAI